MRNVVHWSSAGQTAVCTWIGRPADEAGLNLLIQIGGFLVAAGDDAISLEGPYYLVAATNTTLKQVTLAAAFWKISIAVNVVLAGYSSTFQSLGTVRSSHQWRDDLQAPSLLCSPTTLPQC